MIAYLIFEDYSVMRPSTGYVITFTTLFTSSFLIPLVASAAPNDIFLSEVSIAGDQANDEFIELYNRDAAAFDLSGLQLRRRTQSGSETSIKVFTKGSIIPGHGYYLWANSTGIFALPFADTETSSSALASDNSIGLFTKSGLDGVLLDSLAWGKGSSFDTNTPTFPNPEKKKSLARNFSTLVWSLGELSSTNSRGEIWRPPILPPPPPPSAPAIIHVRFNELLPNPSGDEATGEFIELYNEDTAPTDLSGYTIHDASKTGSYTFPVGSIIASHNYIVLRRSVSKISLNNSDETLSLINPAGTTVASIQYAQTKEGVSLNYTPDGWRGGTPTPGAENILNTLPETEERVPKKGYRNVTLTFHAKGKDKDEDTLKYTWNFGDGHKSYKETTSHAYEKNGTYTVTLVTSDGRDDVTETFTLTIESYPKQNIRIISFVPNPSGRDSDNEYLTIENREKKSIDLQNFIIATGTKKLINHPIRDHFVVAAKSTAQLSRVQSFFTLPNEKGKIELRAPGGKTLQKIKYVFSGGAPDDATYRREKNRGWFLENSSEETAAALSPENEVTTDDKKLETAPILPPAVKETETSDSEETKEALPSPFIPLLNYGTRVTLPQTLVLSFPDDAVYTPSADTESVSFATNILETLNAALNTLQNKE